MVDGRKTEYISGNRIGIWKALKKIGLSMRTDSEGTPSQQGRLDTLVENGTTSITQTLKRSGIIIAGNGSDLRDMDRIKGRAKKKLITQKMVLALVDVAKKKGKKEQVKTYWNTFHCLNRTTTSGNRLYGKYCKNRFCSVCLGIRKADILNRYMPVLKEWEEPYLVTLTIKAIPAYRLNLLMNKMVQGFQRIKDKYRKMNQRGKNIKLVGIKSLECNFNPQKRTYNPHFHLIVPNKETAEVLINEWLKLWTSKWTNRLAQNFRRVENIERDLVECVKYGTKIFTESDLTKKSKQKVNLFIYVSALDNILTAMQGHRLFERFGFNLPNISSIKHLYYSYCINYEEWEYDLNRSDWINSETEQTLSGYNLPSELNALLENNIDCFSQ